MTGHIFFHLGDDSEFKAKRQRFWAHDNTDIVNATADFSRYS
jgi:hypothetical protein